MTLRYIFLLSLGIVALSACKQEAPPPSLPQVSTQTAITRAYKPEQTFVGRLQAQDDVEISVNVTGYIEAISFREGQHVERGQVLYKLDDSEFRADLAAAEAALASAKALAATANRNYKRGLELLPKGAISQAEMDDLSGKELEAEARIRGAEAEVEAAKVDLAYATVKAPISGRIGRSAVSLGDLVSPQSGPLTTLVSIDPIEAIFAVSETTYVAEVGRSQHRANLENDRFARIEVVLELSDGSIYQEKGRIDYFGNRIDLGTGTIEARVVVPNPNATLVSGQYVNIHLVDPLEIDATFIPQAAVQVDQRGTFILSVDAANQVVRHDVALGQRFGDWVVVKSGVESGIKLITRGLQLVRPGSTVEVTELPATEPNLDV